MTGGAVVGLEVRIVNNTRDKLVTTVKRRVTLLSSLIEWIEGERESRGKRLRTLSRVGRPREGVVRLELETVG